MLKKLVLIDGNSIANRAFYALPLLNNDQGMYTNAVYGFTTMLLKLLEEEQPTHMLVAFDAGKETFRHQEYKEYKGKRQKTPSELREQIPLIRRLLDAFSIPHYELDNYEADDIIGTLAQAADQKGIPTRIVTGDKDLLQLITDHVHVMLTRKGISEVEYYDQQKLEEKYGLKPWQIIDMKGLMGDSSDNIPGVPGVGEKTALKLLHQFGSIEQIYGNLDEVSGNKLKEKLAQYKDQALLSKELATIEKEAPVTVTLDDIAYSGFDKQQVIPLFKELQFQSLLERLGEDEDKTEAAQPALNVTSITSTDDQAFDRALTSPSALIVELEGERYHQAALKAFALCNENGLFFIDAKTACQTSTFREWLADEKQQKWVYGAKRTRVALKWHGITLNGIAFDSFLASYLLNPTEAAHSLKDIARKYANLSIKDDEEVYGKGAKRKEPDQKTLAQHLASKAKAVYDSYHALKEELDKHHLLSLFEDLELPLSHILGDMELHGIKVDQGRLKKMGEDLKERIETLTKEIYELAGGVEFNINSPKQLGEILFDKLGLPVIKKTKTGYSTSADVLEKLAPQHEIVSKILDYRQLVKLQTTYIEGLLKEINEQTGKVHTTFQQTITATGRLSSTDPNLQNIPIRLEEGRKIRQAFVPSREDQVILAADYSQIELRILAHLSQDQGLVEAFRQGEDIHTKTAMDVFHVKRDEVTPLMRRQAKAVNFGIIYGISDYGLSQNLNISRKEAKAFIERYFASYPGVKAYMDQIVKKAREDGYVTTLLHRRRYIPEINSCNFNLRSFAERTAMNTPIQGTAADIIKKAMVEIAERLKEEQLSSKLLLQVHDELVFEVPKSELETMMELVPQVMESTITLAVPLKVDLAYGPTWYDAK
ncbi:DNA polymerase I [Caldalkalibacillus thermarum TA2.A1]|uniref:DNA polymerase I n=1 Tax=Caldalkalibacillus thermarum (strain TA2.A1) TaxID=986075 RepID=F5L949_CALTT|nr:DNA polymerase I [Caldalkalibacillus thermarum]EGL82123.1 DNA polymerase I [Caldalkalibacillus thermarum TA2.A1]QZT34951.1 DNA polymerase I [Caldalkalibacillus thermarum TA2.A1]